MQLLTQRLQDFTEYLNANEFPVDPGSLLDLSRLADIGLAGNRTHWRRSSKNCLCRSHQDWCRYDELFNAFWQADGDVIPAGADEQSAVNGDALTMAGQQRLLGLAGTSEKQRQEEEFFGAGDFKALSLADFRFVFNAAQMREIEKLVERVARQARKRVTRRERVSSRGHVIDLRRSMRQSLRYCGKPVVLRYRRKRLRLHRFVLLLDISQSMDVYARLFLRFARILMTVFERSDAFVFNTELNALATGHARLTEDEFERVLNQYGKGWLGGTRIAHSLETFNQQAVRRLVDNRSTVVIFSDGCDTTPPERLAEAVSVIQRRAGKLVWVNPLLGRFESGEADRYMDPVSPHCDYYCSAHNVESLVELEKILLT